MELMDEDLHQLIEDRCRSTPEVPPFRQGVAIDIISQIAAGMAYLHDKGIFHGDLKASNVLVNHHGGHIDAKITNFGVSQKIQLDNRGDASSSDANRGELLVTIQCSLSDTNLHNTDVKAIMPRNQSATSLQYYGKSDGASSIYSGTSFSKMVGTNGWMAPEVYVQVSIKTKHAIGLFSEVDLGAELSLRFENKVSS
jgi:serine/threonine protein kinase